LRSVIQTARRRSVSLVMLCCIVAFGCATGGDPLPMEMVPFKDRAVTQVDAGITVTAAVPSADEARDLFGVSLYKKLVQPVWIEIENSTQDWVSFMPISVDGDYHTPIEVAALNKGRKAREQAEQFFYQNGIDLQLAPGETRSGFLFTNLDEGTKAFNVDIVSDERAWQFTFFIQVPGLAVDHHDVDFESLYADEKTTNFTDADAFIEALELLPCCVVDSKAEEKGDPLNLVMIGSGKDLFYAFIRAGWDETEVVTAASGVKTVVSFFSGGAYRYSPISSLYLFGRHQDIALQVIRDNIHERNHFRLWLAPMTFNGEPVWIGQISRDIGVRFTKKTITTHKIDPDVDETREFLVENLAYHQVLSKMAYVGGVVAAPIDEPRGNLTGDPYFTDGLRVVMWISSELTDLKNIKYEAWSDPER
jgi:hypothetical protein